jgi:probable rRNA maturation factor
MTIRVDLQIAVDAEQHSLPARQQFRQWVEQALQGRYRSAEMTIRLVEAAESAQLNETYRHKPGPTNVLSFPFEADVPLRVPLLGDLVICAAVVAREAQQQGKSLESHWAHMVIHGTLHLIGFDHLTTDEAQAMEGQEIDIMQQLGYTNPYELGMPT